MQVQKLRGATNASGLVPAGKFFTQLAAKLEDANDRKAALQAELDVEDRSLEAHYRRGSGLREVSRRFAAAM